ncbi:MAG: hypothetical protein ACOYOU_11445 [Kiritimatiellia bacterium]
MTTMKPQERIIRGLLYKEWMAHRNWIVGPWALWLACGLVLPVFHHPAWIFWLGLLYVFFAGPGIGGMDAAEGSEEFAFSLPATRTQIYLTRLALFGGNLIALLAVGLLTIAFNVPQHLWGLVVESGLTEPFPVVRGLWYVIAFCAPLAAGACAFVLAALARSRGEVTNAGIQGVLFAGIVGSAGMTADYFCWQRTNGLIVCPALVLLSAAILGLGLYLFARKEGISRPAGVGGGKRLIWIIMVLLAEGLVLTFLLLFLSRAPYGSSGADVWSAGCGVQSNGRKDAAVILANPAGARLVDISNLKRHCLDDHGIEDVFPAYQAAINASANPEIVDFAIESARTHLDNRLRDSRLGKRPLRESECLCVKAVFKGALNSRAKWRYTTEGFLQDITGLLKDAKYSQLATELETQLNQRK